MRKEVKNVVFVTLLRLNFIFMTAESLKLPVYFDQQIFLPSNTPEVNGINSKSPVTVSLTRQSSNARLSFIQIGHYCVRLF
jgi:hypothetical protein